MMTILEPNKVNLEFIKLQDYLRAEVTKAVGIPEHLMQEYKPLTSAEEFYYLQHQRFLRGKTSKLLQAIS